MINSWVYKMSNWLSWDTIRMLYLVLVFLIPLSLPVSIGPAELVFPIEPLMIFLAMLLLTKWADLLSVCRDLVDTPIGKSLLLYFSILLLSPVFSSHLVVTIKYVIVQCLYFFVFYVGVAKLLSKKSVSVYQLMGSYFISFFAVMIYTWYNHSSYDFSMGTSVTVARPFYYDHALYSCCLLLISGICFAGLFQKTEYRSLFYWSVLSSLTVLVGVYFSYCRAAWLSVFGAAVFIGFVWLYVSNKRFFYTTVIVLSVTVIFGSFFFFNNPSKIESTGRSNSLKEQILSIGNVTTDVSNLERINRYKSALRMAKTKPLTGFGAGTFQFAFIPFQKKTEMTRLSVQDGKKQMPGRGGRAHSEYLEAFAELGFPGGLAWLLVVACSLLVGLISYLKSKIRAEKILVLGLLFSLLTFFIHGLFNEFIYQPKAAAIFWTLLATLTTLYQKNKRTIQI